MKITSRKVNDLVHEYKVIVNDSTGHNFSMFHLSDVHFDSINCDRDLLSKHLKQAEADNAMVLINGDFFDAMQGRYDPRGTKGAIRPEYKHSKYLDMIVDDGIEYLSKFNIRYHINTGNHESNLLKRLETDVLQRLTDGLSHKGIEVEYGGYTGYIIVKYCVKQNGGDREYASMLNQVIWYHHGYGGNAKRSKGTLSADIDMMQNPDADIVTKGHDHQSWYMPIATTKIKQNMDVVDKIIHHIRTGSYKKKERSHGWEVEKGFNAPTLGGWRVDTFYKQSKYPLEVKVSKL